MIFQRCAWDPSQANKIDDQNFAGIIVKEKQSLGVCPADGNLKLQSLVIILTPQWEGLHRKQPTQRKEQEMPADRFLAPLCEASAPTHVKPISALFRYMNQIIISLSQLHLCFCHSQPVKSFPVHHLLACCDLYWVRLGEVEENPRTECYSLPPQFSWPLWHVSTLTSWTTVLSSRVPLPGKQHTAAGSCLLTPKRQLNAWIEGSPPPGSCSKSWSWNAASGLCVLC